MSIYKDLLFLHGYLRDLSVADDIEPAQPRKRTAATQSKPPRQATRGRRGGMLERAWVSLMARPH